MHTTQSDFGLTLFSTVPEIGPTFESVVTGLTQQAEASYEQQAAQAAAAAASAASPPGIMGWAKKNAPFLVGGAAVVAGLWILKGRM